MTRVRGLCTALDVPDMEVLAWLECLAGAGVE